MWLLKLIVIIIIYMYRIIIKMFSYVIVKLPKKAKISIITELHREVDETAALRGLWLLNAIEHLARSYPAVLLCDQTAAEAI